MNNILYCGISIDFNSVFNIDDNFDNLYLINDCKYNESYNNNNINDNNKNDNFINLQYIYKSLLTNKYNIIKTHTFNHREIAYVKKTYENNNNIIKYNNCCKNVSCKNITIYKKLKNKFEESTIISEKHKKNYWKLTFKYKDKIRNLHLFKNDYNKKWNNIIKQINSLLLINVTINIDNNNFKNNINKLSKNCKIYTKKNMLKHITKKNIDKKKIFKNKYEYIKHKYLI